MSDNAKWYVVHTYSGYENKVKTNLESIVENRKIHDLITEIVVPVEKVTEKNGEKIKEYDRKLFPGYVLVKMVLTDDTWYVVRNIRGVTGFIGTQTKPVALSEEEALRLGVENKVVEINYAVGDNVRVLDGPFADHIGVVTELDIEKDSVEVTVTMFGRETPVEFELDQVEAVEE